MTQQQQYYEDEVDIVEYIKVIYKHRKMIITITVLAVLFTCVFSLSKPKMYEAQATFFPLNIAERYSSQADVFSESGFTMKKQLDASDLIISMLESRKMSMAIIEQLGLKNFWKAKNTASAIEQLKKASKINLGKNGIIKLAVQTELGELSAKIANAYVDNLENFNLELNIGAQRQIVKVIDRAIVPEERMPRGIAKNALLVAIVSFMFSVFLAFFVEFLKKSDIKKRLGSV